MPSYTNPINVGRITDDTQFVADMSAAMDARLGADALNRFSTTWQVDSGLLNYFEITGISQGDFNNILSALRAKYPAAIA